MTETTPQTPPDTKTCCQTTCCGWKKKLAILFAALIIGMIGFGLGRATSHSSWGMRHSFKEYRMNKMLDYVDATPEQRTKMREALNERKW